MVAGLSMPGSAELLLLTMGGVLPLRRPRSSPSNLPRLAIVVPAHNEQSGIGECVDKLRTASRGDGGVAIVVVADNCSDRTADVARQRGARVLERVDDARRGKGYALDYAFQALAGEDWDAFLIIDADTSVSEELIRLTREAFAHGAMATQCGYLVRNPAASVRTRLMNVALMAFNVLRPRGRARWGLSCGILGNGFGLSRQALERVQYEATSVVEDLEYHLRLVRARIRVEFLPGTYVYADIPASGTGVTTQRTRWEGGRFRMIREQTLPLLAEVFAGRLRLLEPLLELLLLPLALHVMLLLAALAFPVYGVRIYAACGLGLVLVHVFAAMILGGAAWRDLVALAGAPFYLVWKGLMIPKLIRGARASSSWVRTEREQEPKG
jgi:cellulose synthase/poly-beta-1,6-N-acetylglucosamine synthase-like glycosyltransferase